MVLRGRWARLMNEKVGIGCKPILCKGRGKQSWEERRAQCEAHPLEGEREEERTKGGRGAGAHLVAGGAQGKQAHTFIFSERGERSFFKKAKLCLHFQNISPTCRNKNFLDSFPSPSFGTCLFLFSTSSGEHKTEIIIRAGLGKKSKAFDRETVEAQS